MIRAILPYLSGPGRDPAAPECLTPETAALLRGPDRPHPGTHRLPGPQPRPAQRLPRRRAAQGEAGKAIARRRPGAGVNAWIMPRYSPCTTGTCAKARSRTVPAPVSSGPAASSARSPRARAGTAWCGPTWTRRAPTRRSPEQIAPLHRARPRLRVEAVRPRPAHRPRTAAQGGRVHPRARGDADDRRGRRPDPATPSRPRASASCRSPTGRASTSWPTCTRRRSARTAPGCGTSCSPGSRTTRTAWSPSWRSPATSRSARPAWSSCPARRFAGLWGGGTVEGWRGRGIYRALVAHRARAAVRPRLPLPPGRRLQPEPAHPGTPRLPAADDHDAVRVRVLAERGCR